MQPTVSVVLPTFNRAKTISRAIDSVLNQTFPDFELLVVDDGSIDDTDQVLAEFAENPKVRIIRSSHIGCAAARNLGVRAARGRLVAFQDSDDVWLPQKLELAMQSLDETGPETGVFYSDMLRIGSDGREAYHSSPVVRLGQLIDPKTMDFQVWRIGIQSVVMKRECFDRIGLFDESLPRYIDLDLLVRLAQVYHFQHCPQPLVEYHYAADGITRNRYAKVVGRKHLFKKYKTLLKDHPPFVSHQYFLIALAYQELGNLPLGLVNLARAYFAFPAKHQLWKDFMSGGRVSQHSLSTGNVSHEHLKARVDIQSAKIRVIIPFYRGDAYIERCVQSLVDSSCPIEEVVIVDNSPERLSLPAEERFRKLANLTTLTTKPKIGFGNACNIGMDYAIKQGSDVVLLINQDAHVEKDCIEKLCKVLMEDDRAFATFPLSLNYESNDVSDLTLRLYVASNKKYLRDLVLGSVRESYPIGHQGANGSCIALRPKALQDVGYFDPVFWMYGEDRDLLYRATLAGYRLFMVPGARIGHLHSNHSATGSQRRVIDTLCRRGIQIHQLKNPRLSIVSAIFQTIRFSVDTSWRAIRRKRLRLLGLQLLYDLKLLLILPTVLSHRSKARLIRDAQRSMQLSMTP